MNRMLLAWALVFAALPAAAQKIRIDYDHKCDFSRYKTYSWVALPETQYPNQLMQERIVGFVEEALAAKGVKRVEKGGDLLVGYRVDVAEYPQFTTFTDGVGPAWNGGWGWGWSSGWGNYTSTTLTEIIVQGTLVVDLIDSRQKQLVFEGRSTDTISSRPEKNTKRFRKGVAKIFEKYPPGS